MSKTMFFNGIEYISNDFVDLFSNIVNNGATTSGDFLVSASTPNALTVDVAKGKAFIGGYYVNFATTTKLPITANSSGYNRIDRICIKVNANSQLTNLIVIEGTPASSPSAPSVPVASGEYYLTLATVLVGNNATSITSSNITDLRTFKNMANSNYVPSVNNSYDLGSSSNRWKDLYMSGYIYGDIENSEVRIYGVASGVSHGMYINKDGRVGFHDWQNSKSLLGLNAVTNRMDVYLPTYMQNNFYPHINNTYDIGSTANRFRTIHSVNALNTSDKTYKENIEYLYSSNARILNDITFTDMRDFVKDLNVAKYNYIGQEHEEFGFIADDIATTKVGGKLVIGEEGSYSYSTGSYITVVVGALKEEINMRDRQIASLEERLEKLESLLV